MREDKQENDKPKVGQPPKIQKASNKLRRDENKKYFEPLMISIGPLHHGDDEFKQAEELKLRLASLFIKEHHLDVRGLYNKINDQIDILRKFYSEEDIKTFNGDLASIFLVDGCALIHYIDYDSNKKLRDLKKRVDMNAFSQQDLFLLENQLPYHLLHRVLIESIADQEHRDAVRQSIRKFVDKIARNITGRPSIVSSMRPVLPDSAHLLEILWRHLVAYNTSSQNLQSYHIRYTIRRASELSAAWIRFKSNASGSLMDIDFASYWFTGTLRLPSLTFDDSTEPMFLNLIAFEMCPDFENDFPVSSYISFLDSLIDEADDVKVLRNAHILNNALGSDKQVASLFNKIGSTDGVRSLQTHWRFKTGIRRHYDNKGNAWIHERFSGTWTVPVFQAGIATLVLSFVQTWYTIYPSK